MKSLSAAAAMLFLLSATAQANEYDFVIVGGGTAGCVLAARLCEGLPDAKIALLESGTARTDAQEFNVRSPRRWGGFDPTIQSFLQSEINPALGFGTLLLTGRTLGGSSALYTSLFIEPPDLSVLDDWGIDGLTAITARTYLDKVIAKLGFPVAKPAVLQSYADEWLVAVGAAGIPVVGATVKGSATDVQHYTAAIQTKEGVRIDASSAYIYPLLESGDCPNLNIIQGATVTKINMNETTMTATGVTYVASDDTNQTTPTTLTASKEVILSAGPYYSPQLLQLSGIGPADVLAAEGIDVIADLPVGQETRSTPIGQLTSSYTAPLAPANNLTIIQAPETREQWDAGNGGVLGMNVISSSGTIGGGTSEVSFGPPAPALGDQPIMFLVCSLAANVGSVKINGISAFTAPIVELNYMSDPAQMEQLVTCTETYHSIFAASQATFPIFPLSPPGNTDPAAPVNFTEFFLTDPNGVGGVDTVAGCAVGEVVDGSFNVMGVNNLKVIDASALPELSQGSRPMSLVYMIAEMAATKIIDDYTQTSAPTSAPTSSGTYIFAGFWNTLALAMAALFLAAAW